MTRERQPPPSPGDPYIPRGGETLKNKIIVLSTDEEIGDCIRYFLRKMGKYYEERLRDVIGLVKQRGISSRGSFRVYVWGPETGEGISTRVKELISGEVGRQPLPLRYHPGRTMTDWASIIDFGVVAGPLVIGRSAGKSENDGPKVLRTFEEQAWPFIFNPKQPPTIGIQRGVNTTPTFSHAEFEWMTLVDRGF